MKAVYIYHKNKPSCKFTAFLFYNDFWGFSSITFEDTKFSAVRNDEEAVHREQELV